MFPASSSRIASVTFTLRSRSFKVKTGKRKVRNCLEVLCTFTKWEFGNFLCLCVRTHRVGFITVAELVVYQQLCRVISELHLTYRGGLTQQTPAITNELWCIATDRSTLYAADQRHFAQTVNIFWYSCQPNVRNSQNNSTS